jgi:hypothetical protein
MRRPGQAFLRTDVRITLRAKQISVQCRRHSERPVARLALLDHRMGTRSRMNVMAGMVAVLTLWVLPAAVGATIHVTNDFPTIQAAIDAAGSNDTIQVQAGTYREFLNIVAPVHIIGSGSTNCIVHHTNDVLVTITSAGTVELAGMEICGGEVAFGGGFSPTVPRGIVASNTTLVLNDVAVNMTRNFAVTVTDGALYATNVALYTRIVLQQWDVGFQLKGCFARIYQLTQQAGQIDHTININDLPANFSDVRIEKCTIQASHLDYGECIRTYTSSSVIITNCDLYRAAGGDPVTIGNQAIGVNGFSNTVVITGNHIDNLPTGIRVFGSLPNSNAIKIERNTITDCESNGVLAVSMNYSGIDLGGGALQSAGQNYFYNPGARDVELSGMTAGIPAKSNCWTTVNPDDSIIDQLDTNILGRVSYSPTYCQVTNVACSLVPALVTNVVDLFDQVGATVTTNGNPAPGVSVTFSVSGANPVGPTNILTDANGQAGFAYLGTNFGTDTIVASGHIDLNGFNCQATKQWVGLPPQITCPSDMITNAAAGTCARSVTYNAIAVGLPTPLVTYDLPSGTSFSLGVSPVTVTASNAFGTTNCSFTVTVSDTEFPSITCAGDITTNIPFGQTQVNISFGAPTASDNCGTVTTSCSPASGSVFALGTNAVTCTAIDSSANTNTCNFHVIILGLPNLNQPPVALCSNITVNAGANCQATVSALAVDAGSFDNDGTITSRSLTPAGPFARGTNHVTLTVFDDGGASNTCNAQIIVVETSMPTIGPCTDIVTNVLAGVTNAVVSFPLPAASDLCAGLTNYCLPSSGSVFPLGTNAVVGVASNSAGFATTCNFNVIVQGPTHDLAVLSIAPPRKITLTTAKSSVTKPVKVTIENLGHQTETITDLNMLTNAVAFTAESLGICPLPAISLEPPKKGFPVVLAPKKKLTLLYNVTFDCANDDVAGAGHEDFRYTVTVDSTALDSRTDTQPSNDVCPRPPNPAIGDKGCGEKNPDKTLGADVLTDVTRKP